MFYCQKCNALSKPAESPVKVVTLKRPKTYEISMKEKVRVTQGWEIVQEKTMCKPCSEEFENG